MKHKTELSDIEREIDRVCGEIASRYARKCWWADQDELKNVAWDQAQKARRNYSPDKGAPAAYFSRVVKRAVSNFLIYASSPVSASWHDRFNTIGLGRAQVEELDDSAPDQEWADRLLDDKRREARLLARLREVVGQEGEEGLDVLLRHADDAGRPRLHPKLVQSINVAWSRISADEELRRLWCGE